MTEELLWGLPVITYLYLAGLGAGACTVSASIYLRGGSGDRGMHVDIARYGAFLGPVPVMVGSLLLIYELGSFQAGHLFRFLNLYLVINLSPMSIGTWLLTGFIGLSVVYAYTFVRNAPWLPDERRYRLRKAMSWIVIPVGIAVAVYTGVLLGAMPARPFWNSPILAMLFLISSLSTGVAGILLLRALFGPRGRPAEVRAQHEYTAYLLTTADTVLIGFELLVVFLFVMFAFLTVGDVKYAVTDTILGGGLTALFWLGFVIVGLLVPALVELKYVIPKLLYQRDYTVPRGVEIAVSVLVLIGGFLLRYIVVVAGQVTGPVGI